VAAAVKPSPRHLAFARALFRLGCAAEAYREAYPAARKWTSQSVRSEACRLRKHPNVIHTLERLQRMSEQITVASITGELDQARELALRAGQAGAAVQASTAKARLHRLMDAPGATKFHVDVTTIAVAPDLARLRQRIDALTTAPKVLEPEQA